MVQFIPHEAQYASYEVASQALWNTLMVYASERPATNNTTFFRHESWSPRDTKVHNEFLEVIREARRSIMKNRWRKAFERMSKYAGPSKGSQDWEVITQASKSRDWRLALRLCLPHVFRRYYNLRNRHQVLRNAWFRTVTQFSARQMSLESDRLPAMSGIASEFEKLVGGRYLAGLWESDILEGLAWSQRHSARANNEQSWEELNEVKEPVREAGPAPSWSWASVVGEVRFWPKRMDEEITDATYLGCDITPTFAENAMGGVARGALRLRAPMRSVYPSWFRHCRGPDRGSLELGTTIWQITQLINLPLYEKRVYPDTGKKLLHALRLGDDPLAFPQDRFWLMRLFHQEHEDEAKLTSRGLVLAKNNNGTFKRVGYYNERGDRYPGLLGLLRNSSELGSYETREIVLI